MNKHFCPKCGTKYTPGAKFCPKCGYRLTKDTADSKGQATTQPDEKPAGKAPAEAKQAADKKTTKPADKQSTTAPSRTAAAASQKTAPTKRTNPLKGHRWFWYLGLIIAVVVIGFAIYVLYQNNQDYTSLLHQHSDGNLYPTAEFGSDISDDLTWEAGFGFVMIAVGAVLLTALFLPKHWLRRKKLLTQCGVLVVIFLAGLVNLNANHHYTMTSTGLGERYTKNYLSGHIYRYNYLANKKNDDDYSDQFGSGAGHDTEYTHVFLKFNSDGTLGVNVNPYWVDNDQKSYEYSQEDNYRTTGTWTVSQDGQVNIEWDPTDSGAYELESVRVKRKHHKHHHKYKYVQRLVPQYVDSFGDPDTSLPHNFPGDSINGKVKFGDARFKIDGVTLYKLDSEGDAVNEQ
ncbi:MAG: zinc-ribbon domain-containing protein [Limosilactobacillus sp.]